MNQTGIHKIYVLYSQSAKQMSIRPSDLIHIASLKTFITMVCITIVFAPTEGVILKSLTTQNPLSPTLRLLLLCQPTDDVCTSTQV